MEQDLTQLETKILFQIDDFTYSDDDDETEADTMMDDVYEVDDD